MWNNLSYKKRFIRLIIGAVLLIWVSFKFAIMPSVELKQNLNQLKVQLKSIENAPYKLQTINKRLTDIEKQIGDVSGTEGSGGYLIDKVGEFCKRNRLVLNEIPEKHTFNKDEFKIETYKLVIQGSFINLVKLLHEVETKPVAGKVRSVTFESEYDLREKRKYLYGNFYIQSIRSAKEE